MRCGLLLVFPIRRLSCVLTVLGLLALAGSPVEAEDDPNWSRLLRAKALRCTLPTGATTDWDSGQPSTKLNRPDPKFVLHFENIDRVSGKARVVSNVGASDVNVWYTAGGVHFVEQTGAGNLMITSVFPFSTADGLIAVHSRHMATFTGPFPSQTHGTCKVLR